VAVTTRVLICDDSSFARRQLARALPADWAVDVSFAANGEEGLAAVRAGKAEVLFLDLNMPVLDGYQVLRHLAGQDLRTKTIVVSGDMQPEARNRVIALGALAFMQKPVDSTELAVVLDRHGLRATAAGAAHGADLQVDARDCYQEIANVAMGRAADLLARLLGAFVIMPIPVVNMLEPAELHMALDHVADQQAAVGVCQGFIGSGIAGEALLILNEASLPDIADLMRFRGELDDAARVELLMDIASTLIGACLKGVADQLDIKFSQGHPQVLGRHIAMGDLVRRNAARWHKTLAIEMACEIRDRNVSCNLLLLFTEDSIAPLNQLVSYLND
jgi:chemotaxis protein CheY-P-specific phosphatase CheC